MSKVSKPQISYSLVWRLLGPEIMTLELWWHLLAKAGLILREVWDCLVNPWELLPCIGPKNYVQVQVTYNNYGTHYISLFV